MTLTAKVLAEGQLASSKATLYTVPAATTVYIKFFTLVNTNAATQTITIYYKRATSRIIAHVALLQYEQARVVEIGESINMEAGDLIEGEATNASVVDYLISGAEET